MNAEDLLDLPEEDLAVVFRKCRRELDWYPQVSQIREMALGKQEERDKAEALRAYEFCCDFTLRYWHPDIGTYTGAPSIPTRTAYALRQIGGFPAISMRTAQAEPFMRKEFIEAYMLAPTAEKMSSQLATFDAKPLAAQKSLDAAIKPKELPQETAKESASKQAYRADYEVPLAFTQEEEQKILKRYIEAHDGKTKDLA